MGALAGGTTLKKQPAGGGPDGIRCGRVMAEALGVELVHEVARDIVVYRPQSHDDAVHAGDAECAFETKNAFAVLQNAVAGVARRENGPVDAAEIERSNLLRGKNGGLAALIHAGEDETGVEQGIAVSATLVEHEGVRGNMQHAMARSFIEEARAGGVGAGDERGVFTVIPTPPCGVDVG